MKHYEKLLDFIPQDSRQTLIDSVITGFTITRTDKLIVETQNNPCWINLGYKNEHDYNGTETDFWNDGIFNSQYIQDMIQFFEFPKEFSINSISLDFFYIEFYGSIKNSFNSEVFKKQIDNEKFVQFTFMKINFLTFVYRIG